MHTPLHLLLNLLLELAENALASDLALLLCQRQAQGLPEPHRGLYNKITPNSQIWALGDDAIPTLPYACSLNAMPSYYSVIQKAECDGSPSKQVTKCASATRIPTASEITYVWYLYYRLWMRMSKNQLQRQLVARQY
jgi:hypothetical protein